MKNSVSTEEGISTLKSDSDFEFFATYVQKIFAKLSVSESIALRLLGILSKLTNIQLKNMYYRIWRDSDDKFINIMEIDPISFNKWLQTPYWLQLPSLDSKITSIIKLYFKKLITEEFDNIQSSSTLSSLRSDFHRYSPPFLLLIDFDNYAAGLNTLLERMPRENFSTLVVAFGAIAAWNAAIAVCKQFKWFRFIRSNLSVKDAADHCITLAACMANEIISLQTTFYILSLDRFVEELASQLVSLQPERKVVLLTPGSFREVVDILASTSSYPSNTSSYPSNTSSYPSKSPDPSSQIIIHPFSNKRESTSFIHKFNLYAELLQTEFVAKGKLNPLLSIVGTIMKDSGLSMDRGGLKVFIKESIDRGIVKQFGELGNTSINILPDILNSYLQSIVSNEDKVLTYTTLSLSDSTIIYASSNIKKESFFLHRFNLYSEILQTEFVARGDLTPLLSLVGSVMKNRGLSMDGGGMTPLIKESINKGILCLVEKDGDIGQVSIQIIPNLLNSYLQSIAADGYIINDNEQNRVLPIMAQSSD